jgi:RNA polymerase sigma-70 factor (ECF subfamily)
MSDEKFTYTVREEIKDGEVCYFATFADGNGMLREAEITYEVYIALEDCRRHEQRQQRSFERHIERVKLTEGQIAEHIQTPPEPLEESVDATVTFQAALATLTDIQRRRFLLYHEYGLSFEQIAQAESRYKSTIAESITAATEKLKNFFSCNPDERGSECGID